MRSCCSAPAPALLVALTAIAFDAAARRTATAERFLTSAVFAVLVTAASLVMSAATAAGVATPGTASLAIVVLVLAPTYDVVNLVVIAITSPLLRRPARSREIIRSTLLVMLPWNLTAAALAAGTVHAFHTLGPGSLVVVLILQAGVQLLVRALERSELRERHVRDLVEERGRLVTELFSAQRRERQRVAVELHDDALQALLAARQDLAEVRQGDGEMLTTAARRLDQAVRQVRRLLADRVEELDEQPLDLEATMERILRPARDAGLAVDLTIEPGIAVVEVATLAAIANELVANVLAHAEADTLTVRISREPAGMTMVVTDDGRGLEPPAVLAKARDGHVGLALLRRRLADCGGALEIRPSRGAGTEVVVRLGRLVSVA